MIIGLIGSGGREHALCKKLYESKFCKKIICFPGNAGTANLAKNIEVDILMPLMLTSIFVPSMIIKLLPFIIFVSSMWFMVKIRNNKDLFF